MNIRLSILLFWVLFFPLLGYGQDISSIKYDAEYRNNSWAQNSLGLAYEKGEGVQKNPKLAFSWFEKAAKNGYVYAYYNLARHYEQGLSVAADKQKALYWYEKASSAHHSYSCLILGEWYLKGKNVEKNLYKAAAYFKDAAFGGQPMGKYFMGYCYAYGYGVRQDSVKALLWLDRAIEDKCYFAYNMKGAMYRDGLGVIKNEKMAVRQFLLGSSYDDPACQCDLAWCYLDGIGVVVDTLKAAAYYEKAANKGFAFGQRWMGYCYLEGMGVAKDTIQASYWLEKAADQNDEKSYEELMWLYGHIKKYSSLFQYAQKGSELNINSCLNHLAYCYAEGRGTKKDFKKAIETIDRAISLYPNDANLYDSKGEILWMKGSPKEARIQWGKVNSIDPNFYQENDSKLNQYILSEK